MIYFQKYSTNLAYVQESQLALAKKWHLPLFLHSRAAHADFVDILRQEGFGENGGRDIGARGGVVHSFTGPPEDALEYQAMGFHVRFVYKLLLIEKEFLRLNDPLVSMDAL